MINETKPTTSITNIDKPTTSITNESKVGSFSGTTTLVAGTKTISNTDVRAIDNIVLSRVTSGGVIGTLSVGTITAGVSFVINSSSATDTSVVAWQFIQ